MRRDLDKDGSRNLYRDRVFKQAYIDTMIQKGWWPGIWTGIWVRMGSGTGFRNWVQGRNLGKDGFRTEVQTLIVLADLVFTCFKIIVGIQTGI